MTKAGIKKEMAWMLTLEHTPNSNMGEFYYRFFITSLLYTPVQIEAVMLLCWKKHALLIQQKVQRTFSLTSAIVPDADQPFYC